MDISVFLVRTAFLAAAVLFILGIKRMASPLKARSGIQWAGVGMVLATIASFFYQDSDGQGLHNLPWILAALSLGAGAAWISGKKVVKRSGADIGLAFDGDGDRMGVVTAQGQMK